MIETNEEKARVTATRRRPQRFEDLIGQDFVVANLQSSIDKQKVAHAYLFSGPRGCGKTSSARILAKALNCQKGMNRTPCGECDSCKAITKGISLDVIEIDGASNTSVNDVRQIKDEVLFPPNSSRYKIYIIDEVHMLSTSAFNALLKTIEEPPPYIVFIFATTELHKVPATIKSRCQQFNFRLVSIDGLKDTLAKACEELDIKAEDEALYWIAKEATGSVRDAYTLFDQVEAFSDGNITMQKIQEKLGLTSLDAINSIFSSCANGNAKEAITTFNDVLQNGVSIEQFLTDGASYLRSILLLKEGIEKESLLGYNKERFSKDVLEKWGIAQAELAFSLMLQLYKDVRFSLDQRFEVELALSRMSALKDYVSPQDLKMAFDAAKSMLEDLSDTSKSFSHPSSSSSIKRYSEKKNYDVEERFSPASFRDEVQKKNTFDVEENLAPSIKEDDVKFQSIEKLKEFIIKKSEGENGMLSLTLAETKLWQEVDGKLIIYGESSFDVSMLKNNLATISSYVHKHYAKEVKVEILKESAESYAQSVEPAKLENSAQSKSVLSKEEARDFQHEKDELNNVASGAEADEPKTVRLLLKMFGGELLSSAISS